MNTKLFFLLFYFTFFSFAQSKFEPGSYTDFNNVKHNGFIKNLDWRNNPSQIIFKKNINNDAIDVKVESLIEFEIYGISKYKKINVNVDVSANTLSETGYIKEPVFEKKELFLKVLLEGKASLYSINYGMNGKYFFNNSSGEIEELIYKEYRVNEVDAAKMRANGDKVSAFVTILVNKEYFKQLFVNVNCNMNRERIYETSYTESSLVKYFKEYNECSKAEHIIYKSSKNTKINVKALISGNNGSIELSGNNSSLFSKNFDNKIRIGGGLELELVYPYSNNKWATFVEATFNTYKDNAVLKDDKGFSLYSQQNVTVQYNYIQLSLGLRHYFYLNENSKISIDAIYNIKNGIGNNKVDYEIEQDLAMTNDMIHNFAIGTNYSYKKYTFGIRTYSKSTILEHDSGSKYAKYSKLSFMFKYTIL